MQEPRSADILRRGQRRLLEGDLQSGAPAAEVRRTVHASALRVMSRASRSIVLFAIAVLQATFVAQPLAAQDTSRARVVPFDTQHVHKTLFTWRDAALAGGFAGLTVVMFPVDQHILTRLQDRIRRPTASSANRRRG